MCPFRARIVLLALQGVSSTTTAERGSTAAMQFDELCLGGALADIFGLHGRRVLDGLVNGRTKSSLLGGLSGHVSAKLELNEEVLAADLDPHGRWRLRELLRAHDAASDTIEELDRRLLAELADCLRELALLMRSTEHRRREGMRFDRATKIRGFH